MKIHYRRTGGFANIVREVDFESTHLPQKFQDLLNTLPPPESGMPLQSDDFFHELELADGRKFSCTDSRCPPHLLDLFDFILTWPPGG